MEWIHQFVDLFLHLDRHLNDAMQAHGTTWTYVVLFAIIFSETGFVVTPFLPGDSLLFAAGALAATPGSPMSVALLLGLFCVAAIGGNTVNYFVGRLFGDKLAVKFPGIIKPRYLEKTHAFYEKYGGQTIIITRFRADRADVCAVRRRGGAHELLEVHGLQCGGGRVVGRAVAVWRVLVRAIEFREDAFWPRGVGDHYYLRDADGD